MAALYFTGSQLLVVSARHPFPCCSMRGWPRRSTRDIYIDLNSASVAGSKVFIVDLGADGMKAKRSESQAFDTYETSTQRLAFDGEWKAQNLTEDAYMAAYAEADAKYVKMLAALIVQAKKG